MSDKIKENAEIDYTKYKIMFEELSNMIFDAIEATGYDRPSSHLSLMAEYIKKNS